MQEKRRWLPRWQRVELVEKCLVGGMTGRRAADWRRVSVSTVQYWVVRYRDASAQERESGRGPMIGLALLIASRPVAVSVFMTVSAGLASAPAGGRG
jgi:hypothetical protein